MAKVKGRHKGIKYFFIDTVKMLFFAGKGKSKHQAMRESFIRNRTRETPAIYSFSTYNTYKEVVAKFGDYLNECGIRFEKDFRKLSKDEIYNYIDKYFEKQKQDGLAKKTLQKHIAALRKVLGAINPEFKQHFTAENRAKWRDGVETQDCDRYDRSDAIIENLKKINKTAEAIAQLQRLVGCRVGDVKKIKIDEENTRVIIERSKGGRNRSVYFDYFKEDFERVKEYKKVLDKALEEKTFSEIRKNEYYSALRKACRKSGEIYHGSHAFRYEFAQNRYMQISQWSQEQQEAYYKRLLIDFGRSKEYIEEKMLEVKIKDAIVEAIISEELGHSRLDISRHYLKLRGR